MQKTPVSLYKYIGPDRTSVLKDCKIRFTQPSALNDPFEFNPLFNSLVSADEVRNKYSETDAEQLILSQMEKIQDVDLSQFTSEQKKEIIKFAKSKMDALINSDAIENIITSQINSQTDELKSKIRSILNDKIGILSLSETCTSSAMWAHYATESKGLVISFDTTNQFFHRRRSDSDELLHLRQVKYEDRYSKGTLQEIEDDFLILKTTEWAYEKEWRMLIPLESADTHIVTEAGDNVYLFSFPPQAINRIIFGFNSNHTLHLEVKQLIDNNKALSHITLSRITKGLNGFELQDY